MVPAFRPQVCPFDTYNHNKISTVCIMCGPDSGKDMMTSRMICLNDDLNGDLSYGDLYVD
jgi:hypothetical protein